MNGSEVGGDLVWGENLTLKLANYGGVVIKRFSCLPPNPDARPLGTYETKMVARTGTCPILTILTEKRGLHEQS